jgi:hypothetical protein
MNTNTPNNPDSHYDMDEMSFEQKVALGIAVVILLYFGYKGIKWMLSSPEVASAAVTTGAIASNSGKMTAAGIASLLNH